MRDLLFSRHLPEEVGEIVELHLLQHADETVEVERLDEPHLLALGKLLEDVGEAFVVHGFGELAPLLRGKRPHHRGDVGRVHVTQTCRLRLHLCGRGKQARNLVPIDEAIARASAQHAAPGETDLGQVEPVSVVRPTEGDVADCLVVDLAIDQVGPDEHFARARLERVEVDVPAPQPGAVTGQLTDPLGVDEDPPPLTFGDEADDPWRVARTAAHDHHVLDPSDRRASRVEQREPHDPEGIDQLTGHT